MAVGKDDGVTEREANSLKKLANSNFMKFAVQVQHLSAEVQMKIIEQLPEFRKLATEAIDEVSKAHESTLNSSQRSEDEVHQGIHAWRAALITMLDDPSLTLDDKLKITAEISETVRTQRSLHADGNKFKAALFGTAVAGVVAALGIVVIAVTGGKFGIDQGDDSA